MSTPGLILVQGVNDIDEYKRIEEKTPGNWKWAYMADNLGWAQGVNYGLSWFPGEPWYGFFYDDLIPRTRQFDLRLLERLKPGHFVSANNRWHVNEKGEIARLQTGIMSGDLVRAIGFMTLPGTWACYTDDFWERLGSELGIWIKANNIIIETNNPRKGDRAWDASDEAGYGSADKQELMEKDRLIYQQWFNMNYHQTVARVAQLVGKGGLGTARRRVVR